VLASIIELVLALICLAAAGRILIGLIDGRRNARKK
jgi:hypothetical protein